MKHTWTKKISVYDLFFKCFCLIHKAFCFSRRIHLRVDIPDDKEPLLLCPQNNSTHLCGNIVMCACDEPSAALMLWHSTLSAARFVVCSFFCSLIYVSFSFCPHSDLARSVYTSGWRRQLMKDCSRLIFRKLAELRWDGWVSCPS